MNLLIEVEREDDGRWIAEVPELPGVMVYGQTREAAIFRVQALALRVIADRLENGEMAPANDRFSRFLYEPVASSQGAAGALRAPNYDLFVWGRV